MQVISLPKTNLWRRITRLVASLLLGSVWALGAFSNQEASKEVLLHDEGIGASTWSGVVVEHVGEGSAPDKAGLRVGDVILSWERSSARPVSLREARGTIGSAFDWLWLEVEQAPLGTVRLVGRRNEEQIALNVEAGLWDVKVRCRMSPELLGSYLKGRWLIEEGSLESGIALWQETADMTQGLMDDILQCWLQLRIGETWEKEGAWRKAQAAYQTALELARKPVVEVSVRDAIGANYMQQSDFVNAEFSYRAAFEIRRASWGETLGVAVNMNNLGLVARHRGDIDGAAAYHQRALEIQERLAPRNLGMARSLYNLGIVAGIHGELAQAAEYFQRALEIQERLAPGSLYIADSLNGLGNVGLSRGELDQAANYHRRALEIREELAPGSLDVAVSLGGLGNVDLNRGEQEQATKYYQRALEIQRKLAPGGLYVAASLANLGEIARHRGELDRATEYYQQALEIKESLAPGSLNVAESLNHLGMVARRRGELDRAANYHQRALEIQEELAPGSRNLVISLTSLGILAGDRGELDRATEYNQRALEIEENLAPRSLTVAVILNNLGNIAWDRGELDRAANYHQRALEIQEELPESLDVATSLNDLGNIARQRGELEQACTYFDRSMAALENHVGKLGGSYDVQARFRAAYGKLYRDALELYLELDRSEDAFGILERSRARNFLAMLTERDLDFSTDITEELNRTRRRLAILHDRTLHQMMGLSSTQDKNKIATLRKELQNLRWRYEENMEAIRRDSSQLAALHDPQPLNLQGVRDALDPGTVVLSYSVGKERSDLFVFTRDGDLEIHPLPVLEELKNDIELLRNLIQDRSLRPQRNARLVDLSHQLYNMLIEPAEVSIEASQRVLIVPDGPLHLLPFGALIRKPRTASVAHGKFLVQWRPLHFVLSGTVYAELKTHHRPVEQGQQIALRVFGDPHYPQHFGQQNKNPIADAHLRSAVERNLFAFQPLPYSRWEVEQIAKLYPDTTQTYLGPEATEERAKSLGVEPRIVHFAAHAYSDDRDPLSSAVALTIPEQLTDDRDNGLLQAWEIFEDLRLDDADLVVLSACETAVGHDQGGEGLASLSRAFQYAGARTVAASLWKVSDPVTAELMLRFYRRLAAGQPKDAALRGAQISLISDPIRIRNSRGELMIKDASGPYYWAAFQIYGAWQ